FGSAARRSGRVPRMAAAVVCDAVAPVPVGRSRSPLVVLRGEPVDLGGMRMDGLPRRARPGEFRRRRTDGRRTGPHVDATDWLARTDHGASELLRKFVRAGRLADCRGCGRQAEADVAGVDE